MGEIAEMILEGILDEQTGEYLGKAVGYPRTVQRGFYNSTKRKKFIKGGEYLVGRTVNTLNHGECVVEHYCRKKGKKKLSV